MEWESSEVHKKVWTSESDMHLFRNLSLDRFLNLIKS